MDALPRELLEQILCHASSGLNPLGLSATLRNFCFVAHRWKDIAQPLLFSKFTRCGHHYNQIKLLRTLLSCPHLQELVNCMWVEPWMMSDEGDGVRYGPHSDPDSVLDLYHQLALKPRFNHLVIKWDTGERRQGLHEIPSISSLVSSPNLTVISCYRLQGYPIGIFDLCASIRELHLYQSTFSGFYPTGGGRLTRDNEWENTLSQTRPRLLRLYVESADSVEAAVLKWFLHPQCAFDISELNTFHYLDASCQLESYERARQIVNRTSSTLEDFCYDPPADLGEENTYTSPRYATFDPLPHLRYLKLSLHQDENIWSWVLHFLSGLAHPEALEELQLPYSLTLPEELIAFEANGWERLDSYLTSLTFLRDGTSAGHRKFLNLKRVRIGFVSFRWTQNGESRSKNLAEVVPSLVPRCWALGIVEVSSSTVTGFVEDSDCWYHGPR
ncbi:hypothetical protein BDN72DRAFT_902936 [Pluteus cervinus]|uniref:Uncharacterized protein n=1 Tax=Pluteus cervinus TaxID=181527 RepID=A0ACD3AB29_9AGAR|nr:hypothetical protein BDN72DRAFT_902936 [Pluteus cervinus]